MLESKLLDVAGQLSIRHEGLGRRAYLAAIRSHRGNPLQGQVAAGVNVTRHAEWGLHAWIELDL